MKTLQSFVTPVIHDPVTVSHPRRHESSLTLFLVWFGLYFIDLISVNFVYHLPSKHGGELYPCSTPVL